MTVDYNNATPCGSLMAGRMLCFGVAVLFLFLLNFMALKNEKQLETGESMILRLAPVDPLSIMQGFYMELEFQVERDISYALTNDDLEKLSSYRGLAVMEKGEDGVYVFSEIYRGEELAEGEHLLVFKVVNIGGWRGINVKVSSGSFFFEEGAALLFDKARFAELRVAPEGRALLADLLDENLDVIKVNKE